MDELNHHGVKGMKWGVRRYQNKNGTLTPAGRQRYSDDGSERKERGLSSGTKRKIAKSAAIGAAAIVAAYAIKDPRSRAFIEKAATSTFSEIKKAATNPKTKEFVKKAGRNAFKTVSGSATRVGNAMTDAFMLSMGSIAVSKISKRLETDDTASEEVKNRNKVILDTATAGINALTKASSNSSNKGSSNKGGSIGKDVSDALGAPSKKSVDKSSGEYQSLFKDSSGNQRDSDTRATIKSLAAAGYDISQIQEYLKKVDNGTLKHSCEVVRDFVNYYRAVEYVDRLMM